METDDYKIDPFRGHLVFNLAVLFLAIVLIGHLLFGNPNIHPYWLKIIAGVLMAIMAIFMPFGSFIIYPSNNRYVRFLRINLLRNPEFAAAARDRYNSSRRTILFLSVLSFLFNTRFIKLRDIGFIEATYEQYANLAFAILLGWHCYNFIVSVTANQLGKSLRTTGSWHFMEIEMPIRLGISCMILSIVVAAIELVAAIKEYLLS